MGALVFAFLYQELENRALGREIERVAAESSGFKRTLEIANRTQQEMADQSAGVRLEAAESALSAPEQRQRDITKLLREIWSNPHRAPPPLFPAGTNGDFFPELIDNPVYAKIVYDLQRYQVDSFFGPWLRSLEVSPEVRARLTQLLVDRNFIDLDTEKAARRLGLDPDKNRAEMLRLQMKLQEDFVAEWRSLVGDTGMDQLVAQTKIVNRRMQIRAIAQRLSYSDEPLNAEQENRIVELLIAPGAAAERSRGGAKGNLELVLANAKTGFTAGQWVQVKEYAQELGVPTAP